MVNSFSDGKGRLVEPPYGSYVDSWQQPVNSNFGLTDALVSGTTTLNTSSLTPSSPFWTLVFQDFDTSATPWLNPLAGQNLRIVVTGALAYNAAVFIPQNFPGMWIIDNQTTGAFTVTIKTTNPSSSGIVPPQGYMSYVFCDGVNVRWADQGNIIANQNQGVPPGSISAYAGPNIPGGWLYCNGAAYAAASFPALFGAIGYTWGGGSGTFNVPDLQGMFLRGAGGNAPGLGQFQGDQFGSHSHGVNDPGHFHTISPNYVYLVGGGPHYAQNGFGNTGNRTDAAGTNISIQASGGNETRPMNKGVYYMIKT